jgi:hypothetical protein
MPRCEGDQLVTTPGSITIDATKGNRKVPFSLCGHSGVILARDNGSVQAGLPQALCVLALLVPTFMLAKSPQVTVEDTGSTNRPGLRVTFDRDGHATVEPRRGEVQRVTLPARLCKQFIEHVEAAGPMNELPAVHCMKSVSFGSRTFVEFKGQRSPDLSCPAGDDTHSQALQKDANEILQAARHAANLHSGRVFTVPAPHTH